jgi:LPXTG-motif cell wall-anchored protein
MQILLYSTRDTALRGSCMKKGNIDALTIKSGPTEDGLGSPPPSAPDYTLLILGVFIVLGLVSLAFLLYKKKRK